MKRDKVKFKRKAHQMEWGTMQMNELKILILCCGLALNIIMDLLLFLCIFCYMMWLPANSLFSILCNIKYIHINDFIFLQTAKTGKDIVSKLLKSISTPACDHVIMVVQQASTVSLGFSDEVCIELKGKRKSSGIQRMSYCGGICSLDALLLRENRVPHGDTIYWHTENFWVYSKDP